MSSTALIGGARIGTGRGKLAAITAIVAIFAVQPAVAQADPQTTITSAPTGYVQEVENSVTFTSDEPGATFQCKVGAEARYDTCTSPYTISTVGAYGEVHFSVRAVGKSALDLTPAVATWYYLPPIAPPILHITTPAPKVKRMKLSKFKKISGDAFSTSGITEVRLMLRLFVKGEEKDRDELGNRECTHIILKTGKRVKRDCFDRPYVRATGREDWSYKLPKRLRKSLKPGKYTIEVRAFNGMGSIKKRLFVIRMTR